MIATTLLVYGEGNPFFINCYLVGLGVVALISVAMMKGVERSVVSSTVPGHSRVAR